MVDESPASARSGVVAGARAPAQRYDRRAMRLDAEVSEARSLAWPLGAAGLSASLVVFAALEPGMSAPAFMLLAVMVTALSFVALSRAALESKGVRRRVRVDVRGLSIDGELALARQEIAGARVEEEPGAYAVIVQARGLKRSRVLRVGSARIAQALADTLEQTPTRLIEFEALPPWAHRIRWLALVLSASPWLLLNLARHMPGWMLAGVAGLYGVATLPAVLPQRVSIGDDGLLLRWAGRRRFIPFGVVREARPTPLGIELDLEGRAVEIRLTHRVDAEAGQRAAMLERIEHGLALHRALEPAEDEALLLRGERGLETWIREMGALGAGDLQGYRALAIPRERLWAVLENPAADPSARQGAALALRARLDDEERERLAAIGDKSAFPPLRIAIDAVTKAPDVPQLRVALERADEEAAADSRRSTGMPARASEPAS